MAKFTLSTAPTVRRIRETDGWGGSTRHDQMNQRRPLKKTVYARMRKGRGNGAVSLTRFTRPFAFEDTAPRKLVNPDPSTARKYDGCE
jgi:hypothetical protein